jgi:hypothetical protein
VTLIAAPEQATALLAGKARLLSAPHERIARLLADLDDDEFAIREKASAELAKLGEEVEPCLRRALRQQPGPEVRQRLEKLLAQMRTGSAVNGRGEMLRGVRAVDVLETIGTAEARAVLEALARGTPISWLTEEAREALRRLSKK